MTYKDDTLVTTDFENFYPVFRWEGNDLVLDNLAGFLDQSGDKKHPEVLFGTKLVEVMKWIGTAGYGFYLTNGNLRSEADSAPEYV